MNKDNTQIKQSKIDPIFTNVKDKEGKVHVCAGNMAVSKKTFDTFKQADEYIAKKPWEIITNLCYIIITKENEIKKESAKDTEKSAKDTKEN